MILGWWLDVAVAAVFQPVVMPGPGCRAGRAGFHGPAVVLTVVGACLAGQPGARAWSLPSAVVIWLAHGQLAFEAQPEAPAAAYDAPGDGEEPQPEPLGFPPSGGSAQGEQLHPGEQLAGRATISHQIWFWA